jgi:hypothetical protein
LVDANGQIMKRLFTEHPNDVGENYFEHMGQAFSFALVMLRTGAALIVHAIIPGFFVKTGSKAILSLHARMLANRPRAAGRLSDELDFVI